jgi:outer membrane protein assembly factor BamB
LADGEIIWKARIGADSDSTPAVANGLVYTAAEDGIIRCYKQATGELVWQYKAEGGLEKRYPKERSGIWASPVLWNNRVYIGSNNGYLYCLTADEGRLVWRTQAGAPIWGTSPVVDGRVVFGDKSGRMHMLSAETGEPLWDLKIGDNVNATPAILGGRIYIGAFNGLLYCLGANTEERREQATNSKLD